MIDLNNHDSNSESYYTYRPSTAPLIFFHRRVVKTFSPLPKTGKIFEIAKRIILIVITPFAYLLLGLIAIAGYGFSKPSLKTVNQQPAFGSEQKAAPPNNDISGQNTINNQQLKVETPQRTQPRPRIQIEPLRNEINQVTKGKKISRAKCLITYSVNGNKKCCEMNGPAANDSSTGIKDFVDFFKTAQNAFFDALQKNSDKQCDNASSFHCKCYFLFEDGSFGETGVSHSLKQQNNQHATYENKDALLVLKLDFPDFPEFKNKLSELDNIEQFFDLQIFG